MKLHDLRGLVVAASLLCVIMLGAAPVLAAPGEIDSTFNSTGLATNPVGFAVAGPVALLPDSKIAVGLVGPAGSQAAMAVARYKADGSIDQTYGAGGVAATLIGSIGCVPTSLGVEPTGKLVLAGKCDYFAPGVGTLNYAALVRFNVDGALDPTFGVGGIVTTMVGEATAIAAISVKQDGSIVVAGDRYSSGTGTGSFVARYLPNGNLDTTFGASGFAVTTVGGVTSFAHGLAIQGDGKIVTVGRGAIAPTFIDQMYIARHLPDGALDASFGFSGIVVTAFVDGAVARSIAIQPDGKILIVGAIGNFTPMPLMAMMRLNSDGSLDATLNAGGVAAMQPGIGYAVSLQPNGAILVGAATDGSSNAAPILARYASNGTPDVNFGLNGVATWPAAMQGNVTSISIQPDGRIITAVTFSAIARFLGDNSLATTSASPVPALSAGNALLTALILAGTALLWLKQGRIS